MSVAKVRACSIPDAMKPEQNVSKSEKEGHDPVDDFIRQATGKEPFLSFSRGGESPVQWIQLLHALDQQGSSKVSNGSKADNCIEGKEQTLDLCNGVSSFPSELNGVKKIVHPLRSSGVITKGTRGTSEQMQTLKIPEAVVAFAQAAAKANGEPEKYLPGWPLLSPSKVQLQKCDKCSREFCSPINYRRHIRVHRRSLNIDKGSRKNRECLGAFWDKLSVDEAKEIVSFKDVAIEEVTGTSVIRALTSLIRKPGFSSLPPMYVKAGATLLDVVQARPSRFPILSHELFCVLDDASEKTFLCAGTAVSMQKFVFDGEAGKIALDMKNLVACTSFLLEQKLVEAWLADKDVEALRCQKLLVEEEEAAQKRQAELLERRRLKKLKQKEQKAKELIDVDKADSNVCSPDTVEGTSSTGMRSPRAPSESGLNTPEASLNHDHLFLEPIRSPDPGVETNGRIHSGPEDADQNIDHRMPMGSGPRQQIVVRRSVPWQTRNAVNGFHSGQVPATKPAALTKHGSYRDQKAATLANGHKVWTRKTKPENEDDSNGGDRVEREHREQPDQISNCEVLIGSISITLGDCNGLPQDISSSSNAEEKLAKQDSTMNSHNRSLVKLWRPVSRQGRDSASLQSGTKETKAEGFPPEGANQITPDESCLASAGMGDSDSKELKDSMMVLGTADLSGLRVFSRRVAEAFLAQRWKEAIAADHVQLVLTPENDTSDCIDIPECNSDCCGRRILGSAENRMAGESLVELASSASKPKFRAKPERGYRLKYVPKQRHNVFEE